ncbi:MAG: dienelactone hydrolase family protein [Bdellovibrionales bacterium]|nr:dienelactone hydrolase family protein [Bdellovibrionales bacterium]
MMKKYFYLGLAVATSLGSVAFAKENTGAKIETREVEYTVNGAPFKGLLALPKGTEKVPGVLVIHEWWGHNEYVRKRARMLAEMGYAAFALDMYGKDKHASDPKQAGQMMNEALNSGQIQARFDGAMKVLKSEPRVKQDDIAAIGYCFGGNVVLTMARAGEPLRAVASFHGSMPAPGAVKENSVKAEVLVLHGEADEFVAPTAIEQFKREMTAAKAKFKVVTYPGAKHGFSDPDSSKRSEMHHIPVGYNKDADEKSWAEMTALFKRTL